MTYLLWIVVGLLTGWETGKRMRGYGYGPLLDAVMGGIGGVLGGFILSASDLPGANVLLVSCLGAAVGAVSTTGLVGLASGKSRFAQS